MKSAHFGAFGPPVDARYRAFWPPADARYIKYTKTHLFFSSSPAAQPKILRPSPSYSFFPVANSSNSVLEKKIRRFEDSKIL